MRRVASRVQVRTKSNEIVRISLLSQARRKSHGIILETKGSTNFGNITIILGFPYVPRTGVIFSEDAHSLPRTSYCRERPFYQRRKSSANNVSEKSLVARRQVWKGLQDPERVAQKMSRYLHNKVQVRYNT